MNVLSILILIAMFGFIVGMLAVNSLLILASGITLITAIMIASFVMLLRI